MYYCLLLPFFSFSEVRNMGINLTAPQNLLHVDGVGNAAYSQFTNTTTGSGITVFQVGVVANGNAELKSNYSSGSNSTMNFYTAGTQKMTITNTGKVGLGTAALVSLVDINGTLTVQQIIIKHENKENDLLMLLSQMQEEINALKQQLTVLVKN